MILIILFALVVISFTGAFLMKDDFEPFLFCGSLLFICFIICAVAHIFAYQFNAHDVIVAQEQYRLVKVYQDKVDNLERLISETNVNNTALMNKDNPMSSVVKALENANDSLARVKSKKEEAIITVKYRARGLFSLVVSDKDLEIVNSL